MSLVNNVGKKLLQYAHPSVYILSASIPMGFGFGFAIIEAWQPNGKKHHLRRLSPYLTPKQIFGFSAALIIAGAVLGGAGYLAQRAKANQASNA